MIKVQDFAFNKIPAHMISKAINKMLGAHNADVKTLKKGIIADVMFICVSKMMCGGSYEETAELFASGQIMNVLNCKKLGGPYATHFAAMTPRYLQQGRWLS